jgi:hypothetical protein
MRGSDAHPSAEQLDLFTYAAGLEEEQAHVEQVNDDRVRGRGYLVFAIDPAVGPDEPGYRRVFTTEAKTPGQAIAKVRLFTIAISGLYSHLSAAPATARAYFVP